MKIAARRAALSIISLVVSILIGEVCLRIFAPVRDPYEQLKRTQNQYIKSEFPPNSRFLTEPEEGLKGISPNNLFSTNNMGFRGDYLASPKPKTEFRIFIVGGSTTECFYLDDSRALGSMLQKRLSQVVDSNITVKVYGAGKSGDASDDHVSMIVHRLVHLEPDMVVLFSGVNDLTRAIYNYDYQHYHRPTISTKPQLIKMLATEYQIPRRLFYLYQRLLPSEKQTREQITLKSSVREQIRLHQSVPVSNDRPRVDANAYGNNLRTIIGTAKANNIQLVLITQQSTWNSSVDPAAKNWHAMLFRNGVKYREDFMNEALELLNDEMRGLAIAHSIPLYDLSKSIPKSLEFFFDDVHFNEKGAATAGSDLATLILEKRLIILRK